MVTKHITISAATTTYVVRAAGAVIAESDNALLLFEGDMEPVIYFPREDVGTIFLDASEHTSHCPHKGDANYFHIEAKSGRIENAAWSYETPKEGVERIAGHIAFYESKVAIEAL
jgi:uncharacterized protein (DUF427 family)